LGGGPDGGSGPPRKSQLLGACDGGLVDYGVGTLPAASAVSLVLRLPLPVPVSGPVAITWLWTGSFSGNGIDLSAPTTFLLLDPKEISLRYRAEQWTDFKLCVLARRADGLPFGGAQGWVGCPGLDAGFTGFANVPSLDFSGLPNGSCVEMTLLATPADGGIFR
jgi:hypothetical protein